MFLSIGPVSLPRNYLWIGWQIGEKYCEIGIDGSGIKNSYGNKLGVDQTKNNDGWKKYMMWLFYIWVFVYI